MTVARRAGWRGQAKLLRLVGAAAAIVVGCTAERQGPLVPTVDPCTERPCDVAAVVAQLGDAYRQRDYAHLARLLHDDYWFILHPDPLSDPPPPEHWNQQEELRIHRRMLAPQSIQPSEPPLDPSLWVVSVTIALTPSQPFDETFAFYRSDSNPGGLDRSRWKAWHADYDTSVLWDTRGEIDYEVQGRALFVIAQDLGKAAGEPGAYLLYRWQDLGSGYAGTVSAASASTWSQVKKLYYD